MIVQHEDAVSLRMRCISRALFAAVMLLFKGPMAASQTLDYPKTDATRPSAAATDGVAPNAMKPAPAMPATVTLPLPAGCDNRPNAIGLSRIVEIDTAGGPRLGHSQYKDVDFLQDGEIVLTFDDGPMRRYTKPILDTLDAHCTRATFFSVGRMALADPAMLQETARRGHTIASHTWSHAKFTTLSAAKAKYEIELGNSAVTKALGTPIASFFRFPYLRDTKAAIEYLRSRNLSAISIEVDSQDFRTHNPGQVLRNVVAQLKIVKKGIILFHDIQPATAGALSSLLDNLKAGGFKVVHLISKQPSTTLPEYDAMVVKEIERKRLALAGQLPANRAVAVPPGSGPNSGSPPVQDAFTKPVQPAPANGVLPWEGISGPPAASAPPDAAPAAKRPPRKPLWYGLDDDPWRLKTLGD